MNKTTFDYKGEFLTLREIAERTGQPVNRLRMRISRGWSIRAAITTRKMSSQMAGSRGKPRSYWSRTLIEKEK